MATEKRLICDEDAKRRIIALAVEHNTYTLPMDMVINIILHQTPTVDAVEVVHGRWVIEKRKTLSRNPYMDDNYHAHATCSECGFCIHSENASFGYPKLNTTNYCPNCGAKMDSEKE